MSKTHQTLLTFMGVLLFIGGTAASEAERNRPPCPALQDLLQFVMAETGYSPLSICPRVIVASDSDLASLLDPSLTNHGDEALAVFMPSRSEIYLSHEIGAPTPLGLSYLVHELVHAFQFQNGTPATAPCPGWLEAEAYSVQSAYLRSQGASEQALDFQILGLLQGACGQAYHPDFNSP